MVATLNAPLPSRVIDLSGIRRTSLSTAAPRPLATAPPATPATQESQPPELPPPTARTTSQASSVGSVGGGGGGGSGGAQRIAAEALKAICDLRGVKTVVLKKAAARTGSEAKSAGPGEMGKGAQKEQGQPIGVVLLGAHFGDSDGTGAEDSQDDTDGMEDYYFEDVDGEEKIRIKPNANALKRIMSGVQGHNKRKLAIPTGDAKLQQEQLKTNESLERLVRLNGAKEILRLARTYNIGVRFTEPDLLEEAKRALREDDMGVGNGAEGALMAKAGQKGVKKLRKPCQQVQGSTGNSDQAGGGGGVAVGGDGGGEGSSIAAEPAPKKAKTQGGVAAPKRVGLEGGGAKALLAGAFARALQRKVPKVVKVVVKQVGTQEAATPNAGNQGDGTPVASSSLAAVAVKAAVPATTSAAQTLSQGVVADDVTVVHEEDASLASGTTSTASSRGAGRKRKRGGRGGGAAAGRGPAQRVAGQAGAAASQKQPSQSQQQQQTPRVPPQQQRVPPPQQKQAGKAISALNSGGDGSNNDASSSGMGAAGRTTTTTSGSGTAVNGRGRGGGARRGRGGGVSLGFQRALQGIGVAKRGGRGGGLAGASNKQK